MARKPIEKIERDRERIRSADHIDPDDRENLLRASKLMRRNQTEWGDKRHHSILQRLIILAYGGTKYPTDEEGFDDYHVAETYSWHGRTLSETLEDQEAAGDIVDWIHRTYTNEETKRDYRNSLRVFGKLLTNDDPTDPRAEPPASIDWISATTPQNYKPLPEPGDMISWDEVKRMCEHPRTNPRDAACLAVAWDAGPRSGELQKLRVGDLSDHEIGMTIRVDGKTGPRDVTITNAVSYVRQWLNQHPANGDNDAPLWSKLRKPEGISYRCFRDIFQNAADRIDLGKPDTPTNFRKSSASTLASDGMNQAILEDRYGWVRGSELASRYIAVFSDASDRALAKARGMEYEPDTHEETGPKACIRCDSLIDRDAEKCDVCGALQDRIEAQNSVSTGGEALLEMIRKIVDKEFAEHPGTTLGGFPVDADLSDEINTDHSDYSSASDIGVVDL